MNGLHLVPVVNPELEAIRRNVPDPPNVTEECFNDWLARSANYSFKQLTTRNQVGWNILHDVAKFVDGTPVGANGDWKQLAGFLGLHIHDIVRIENFSTIKGATIEVLSLYALNSRATLANLLEALQALGRKDILLAVSGNLTMLFNNSSVSNVSGDTDSEMDSGMEVNVIGEEDSGNLKSVPLGSSTALVASKKPDLEASSNSKKCVKTVLLTFAQDGYDLAKQVACQIRSLNLGIGVVVLEENSDELEFCPESIYRWFHEVDFIIPIITDEYLWQITPRTQDDEDYQSEPTCMDARYARLIYVMMLEEFQRNRCLNYRVRPIESDTLANKSTKNFLLRTPIFSCRKSVSQIDKLASVLATAKTRVMIR